MRSPANPERCGTVRPLAGEVLLEAWECGSVQSQPGRAITLLMAGCPHLSPADAAAVTLPARDLALLDLRRRSFGATLALFAECASCGERLEFTLPADTAEAALERAAGAESALLHEGCSLRLRLADTCDIAAAAAEPDLDAARTLLLDRCLDATDADGNAIPLEKLPRSGARRRARRARGTPRTGGICPSLCSVLLARRGRRSRSTCPRFCGPRCGTPLAAWWTKCMNWPGPTAGRSKPSWR